MIKTKKQMFIVIGAFILVMMLGTITYAFFNYTRTGTENRISVGRISFITNQTETINLTNVFPISSSEVDTDTDNVDELVITIEGDTDYGEGLEYLVTTTNPHIYTSEGKTVPISLDIEVDGLGDESSTYFTSRNSKDTTMYKIMSAGEVVGEQQLLVGYIKPNTTRGTVEGIDGSITIKAYIDKDKVAITDTPEENEEWQDNRLVISTSEWNLLQQNGVSFKVKVEANEGIWVGEPFYDVMKRSTVMDNINSTYVNNSTPGIDFTQISSNTNGKGIYTLSGTENDAYPVMYYRGEVDNNVLFGGFCWKIVRTTDTGGIKLIYNGNPVNNQCGNDRILVKNQIITFDYSNSIGTANYFSDSYEYDSTNKVFVLTGEVNQINWSVENTSNIIVKYTCLYKNGPSECSELKKVYSYDGLTNEVSFTQITQDSSIILDDNDPNKDNVFYNLESSSPASVGYMYGTDYVVQEGTAGAGSYWSNSFIYENGVYKLINPIQNGANATRHYTCASSDPNGTCESIRYYKAYYRASGQNRAFYITLQNGKSVEDALNEMFVNEHDSLAKTMIDTWYRDNMSNYTNRLEDTIYCNDRSIKDLGGWNPNGGGLNSSSHTLKFNLGGIKCNEIRDSFTVSSEKGNGKLDYPVGMLTDDEEKLAGAIYGTDNSNTSFYLYDGNGCWTMTPYAYQHESYIGRVYSFGNSGGTRPDHNGYMSGFRPVISLKEGTSVSSGNGTPTDPYIVK